MSDTTPTPTPAPTPAPTPPAEITSVPSPDHPAPGTPVTVRVRGGKLVEAKMLHIYTTLKGIFYKLENLDGTLRSARPAHVKPSV